MERSNSLVLQLLLHFPRIKTSYASSYRHGASVPCPQNAPLMVRDTLIAIRLPTATVVLVTSRISSATTAKATSASPPSYKCKHAEQIKK